MPPTDRIEEALARGRAGEISLDDVLVELADADLYLPIDDSTSFRRQRTDDGRSFVPAFSTLEQFRQVEPDAPYLVAAGRDLVASWEPDLWMYVNPEGRTPLMLRADKVTLLASQPLPEPATPTGARPAAPVSVRTVSAPSPTSVPTPEPPPAASAPPLLPSPSSAEPPSSYPSPRPTPRPYPSPVPKAESAPAYEPTPEPASAYEPAPESAAAYEPAPQSAAAYEPAAESAAAYQPAPEFPPAYEPVPEPAPAAEIAAAAARATSRMVIDVQSPKMPPPDAVVAAVRQLRLWHPEVAEAYLFEAQDGDRGARLVAGLVPATGSIDDLRGAVVELMQQLPAGQQVEVMAIDHGLRDVVASSVPPVA